VNSHRQSQSQTSPGHVVAWGLFVVGGLCLLTGLFGGQSLGFSLAACFGCGGLTFLTAGTTSDTRGSHAWRMVLAWLVTTALAAASFVPQTISNLNPTSLPNSWVLFAGFAAILFIAQRVTRGLNSVRTDLSSLLTELWVLSLATAFASFGSNNQPSVPAYFVALMIRLWSLGIAVEGLLRLTMAALSGTAVSETLSTQFLLRQLATGRFLATFQWNRTSKRHTPWRATAPSKIRTYRPRCGAASDSAWLLAALGAGHRSYGRSRGLFSTGRSAGGNFVAGDSPDLCRGHCRERQTSLLSNFEPQPWATLPT
jgi:hypothetical protein